MNSPVLISPGQQSNPPSEWLAYYEQLSWLEALVTDRQGARYFEQRTRQQRLRIYRRRMQRVTDFLDFAGRPQDLFSSVHVAGTSGKGSVVTMIAAILHTAGLHTGQHISPYLEVCNEKLVVDGKMISPSAFAGLVGELRSLCAGYRQAGRTFKHIKYSDAWAALVYLWFASQQVDWAVVETGMGGRYDATNVLPSRLAVITNVNYDHLAELGPDLKDIAWHKAGIIKPGMPVVTGETNPEVLNVIFKEARQKSAPVYAPGRDYAYKVHQVDEQGVRLDVRGPFRRYPDIFIPMQGAFQAENAATAIASVDVLGYTYGLPITPLVVRQALASHNFPGRMENIQQEPLVLLDGAHNPHKMQALADSLRAIYPGKPITGIIGVLGMKDAEHTLCSILPMLRRVIFTRPHVLGKPAAAPEKLAELAARSCQEERTPSLEILTAPDVRQALHLAQASLVPGEMLLVTGSLYLIGEARALWVSKSQMLAEAQEGEAFSQGIERGSR